MSLADKLGNIYTNLNTALSDTNSALVEKGGNEVADISSIGDEIRGLETGGSNELAMSIVDRSIESIELSNITKIGNYAFHSCGGLTEATIGDNATTIGISAFHNCTSLTSITIGNSVTSIGISAFHNCTSLKSIIIPDSVTSMGDYAFSGCTSLESITIPDSVTSIGTYAFYNCTALTSITIPDSVTSIGGFAFYGCTSLASVTIGNSVTSISYSAFEGCTSLTDIYLNPTTPPTLSDTYSIPSTTTVHVPVGSGDTYKSATNWSSYTIVEDIVVE